MESAQEYEAVQILHEPQRSMSLAQELALARAAWNRSETLINRHRLAILFFREDDFDGLIDLLGEAGDLNPSEDLLLIRSYLASETEEHAIVAFKAAQRSAAVAAEPALLAALLADQAKAATRLGKADEARSLLDRALAIDPGNKDACKRLAALDLAEGRAKELTERCVRLREAGVGHARLHAARVLGEAARGELAAAHTANGLDLLGHCERLEPPPGWSDSSAFNAALAEELLAHKGLRFERYGSASNLSWRIDSLARPDTPLVKLLLNQIADRLMDRIGHLVRCDHPWVADKPEQALLRAWCVITDGAGYEGWHVHQFGWLSGVYYVQIPDGIRLGSGPEGCIGFGLPEEQIGAAAAKAFGDTTIRPEPGMMLTFPSHVHHRTVPHGEVGRRICVAFDLQPR